MKSKHSFLGKLNPMWGRKHSEETKQKIGRMSRKNRCGYYTRTPQEKMRLALAFKGKHHTQENKELIGKIHRDIPLMEEHKQKIGKGIRAYLKKHPREKKVSPIKLLMKELRKTPEYLRWKENIIKSEIPTYPKVPKWTQVHHLYPFSYLLKDYNITTVEEGRKCKNLWRAEGCCLTRGEHFYITRIGLYKYVSRGFIFLMHQELKRLEVNFREGER